MSSNKRALAAFDFDNTITESTCDDKTTRNGIVFNMGSARRINKLRILFRDLKGSGVILIVLSLNFRETIQNVLGEHGLLEFFSGIYDRHDIWQKGILTKQMFIKIFMEMYSVDRSRCVLVDDQITNLINAPCCCVEIKGPGGIRNEHDSEIRQIFMHSKFYI
jgi:FMN phosphatase YigB (HAD superfamily)